MKAIARYRGEQTPRVIDIPKPKPADGEVLVRTIRVGIDGSDRRILSGEIGSPPNGSEYLVLGHEAVGVVVDANGTDMSTGTVVAPLVRRPSDGDTERFERGEPDMAEPGSFVERGIDGSHGYMAEYFTSRPEYLVPVPDAMKDFGFLVEPLSIAEKAIEQALAARSAFDWRPEVAVVLGNGSLGLLALSRLVVGDEFDRTYCLGRRDRPDPTIDFIEALDSTYVDSRETPVDSIPEVHEPADMVYEATGYERHAVDSIGALAANGVACLQGVPGPARHEIDLGSIHRDVVVNNKAILGNVNSRRSHYERAVESLRSIPESRLDQLVTNVYEPTSAANAFADDDSAVKTAIEFG